MVKMKKHVKKLIERAIEQCGPKMHDVRRHLTLALVEVQKEESKDSKKSPSIHQQWTLDLQTGTLRNLSRGQAAAALGRIEGMISDESKKLEPKEGPSEFLLG